MPNSDFHLITRGIIFEKKLADGSPATILDPGFRITFRKIPEVEPLAAKR